MLLEKVDSIIFDLDGTMWDSSEQVLKVWNEVTSKSSDIKKEITLEDLESVMGLQIKEIGERFFPYLSKKRQEEILKECCDMECKYLKENGGKLYEELEKTLNILMSKYKLFIVSNCGCGYIESFLEAHKLDKYFSDFENPGRTGLTKGENIKVIISRNNLKSPIYVGDTQGDRNAARVAEIPFVYASYGFGKVEDYDYKISKFNNLLEL